MVVRYFINCC